MSYQAHLCENDYIVWNIKFTWIILEHILLRIANLLEE